MSEVVSSSSKPSDPVEANRQNFNIDWRAKKPVFDEQMSHFCMKEEMADVEFVFNHQNKITKIPAHTFALAVASEVFQKELTYGSENETKKRSKVLKVVEVRDERVEINAFRITLLFIYNAYKNVELTGDSALAVLYIAMKYMVKPLELHCINYLLANLNAENVLTILQFCIDCQTDTRLMDECRKFIQIHTKNVVEAESFKEISHECLSLLLTQSSLDISEVSLFEAVVRWAKSACEKSGKNPNVGKNLRLKIGKALDLIRFPAMSIKEFAEFVGPTGILNSEEKLDITYMIGGANPVGSPISAITTPRKRNEYVASMDVLEHTSCTLTKHKLFLLIRIDNFPAFVASKAHYYTREFTFSNVLWSVCIYLKKYCQNSRRYINITSGSLDQPECLAACVCGKENIHKKGAFDEFDVSAKFKLKQPPTSKEHRLTTKFNSDTTKCLLNLPSLARIDELLDAQNGYLIDNSLQLLVDVSISEMENK